jgi:4-amino-4-deoxy-L-arabinose transferase-like glycosyltransferase
MKSEFLSDPNPVFGQNDVPLRASAHRSARDIFLSRALRLLLWSFGAILLVWAFRDPRFRDAEGFVTGTFCLPITASIALLVLGTALTTSLRKSAFWFSLAIIGQGVALQLLNAGHALRYQHYSALGRLLAETHPVIVVLLALQSVLVAIGLKAHFATIRTWLAHNLKIGRLLLVGLAFFITSATVSRSVSVYLAELPFATFIQAVNLANMVLVVLVLPEEALVWTKSKLDALLGDSKTEVLGSRKVIDRFIISAAVWVIVAAALLSFFSYQRHPHIADEVVYLYQARYFASGMLTMTAPAVPEAFHIDLMNVENGRWFCPVPPGWPLVLAFGAFFGLAWLVNPLLAGLTVLLAYSLIRELYDRSTARFAVLLMCASPWYIFMAMNFMTHILTLCCALAAALAVIRSRKTNNALWALAGGMAAGFVTLIRPLDGIIVGGLVGLLAIGVGGKRLKLLSIAGFGLGCILIGATQLGYNKLLTGNPMTFPINAYNDKYHGHNSNAYGFGPDRGMGWEIDPNPGHGPVDAIINANLNTTSINFELFGWSTGSLLFFALILFSGTMTKEDYLLTGVCVAVFVAYFFYYFSGGPDFGARYWFLMLLPLVVLTVRGVQSLERKFTPALGSYPLASTGVMVATLSLSALSLVNYFPWRAIDKYHHYLGMRPDMRSLAAERGFGKSLVLIRGDAHPDYASAAIYNPLDLHADAPVYAWDRNPEVRAEVLKAYPDRPVWIVDGPSLTHGGFEIIGGPISAQALLP